MTSHGPNRARGHGVRLRPISIEAPLPEGVEQALRDGVERGFEGQRQHFTAGAQCYEVHADGLAEAVGIVVVRRDRPVADSATFEAVAIAPTHRGHAYGMRALLAAEAQLARAGIERCFAVVPRTNGRGLYFMLRCGYAPLQQRSLASVEGAQCTWFARVPTPDRPRA